jgi:hypothetical protein
MVERGYDAFMKWDGRMRRKVGVRRPDYCMQVLLWVLKGIELMYGFKRWIASRIVLAIKSGSY